MFQYPGQFAYQMPSLARANLQAFLTISGRFASTMQALAELNVQTVNKMVEESNALLKAGDEASAGDVFGWQSIMLAQFPQKAASYGQHVLSIITSTEADVVGEVRSQYEQNGIKLKGLFDTATTDATEAAQSTGAVITDLADTATTTAEQTSGVILDASGEITQSAQTAVTKATRAASKRSS
ncbi:MULTISPECIES: phasin family protein [unclassified Caballeronia]|uniref:phasin family protein n=1 Tax=unclassified Caballeronia TaxID=2646786 RepID=UPI0020291938|nr:MULTISPECIES: phasin family protein [unclassified Caballeronia]MDR5775102.1 phasin family protein [Caballeronia sp. LZ002]MDR5801388.1 phasin family protein [Caballeronia sp. LZ001]MDR5850540.1 phasin family protein [Caballeronia sp. LZ003]